MRVFFNDVFFLSVRKKIAIVCRVVFFFLNSSPTKKKKQTLHLLEQNPETLVRRLGVAHDAP